MSSCQSGDAGVEQCVDVTLQVPVSGGGGGVNGAAASLGRCNYRRPACSSSLRLQMAPYVCQTKRLNKSHPVIQDAALHCGSGNRSLLALIKPFTPSSPLHQTSAVADVLPAVTHFLLLLLLHHLKAQCVKLYVFDIHCQSTVDSAGPEPSVVQTSLHDVGDWTENQFVHQPEIQFIRSSVSETAVDGVAVQSLVSKNMAKVKPGVTAAGE